MAYTVTGTAGNDTLNQSGDTGPGTVVGLAGDDCIFQGTGPATITGDSGNDTVVVQTGNTGTVHGGTENDTLFAAEKPLQLVNYLTRRRGMLTSNGGEAYGFVRSRPDLDLPVLERVEENRECGARFASRG